MVSSGLRRFSVLTACSALLLVVAGGLVTSNDAALSIPDWPLSWGKLIPPLEGGIRYAFAHRVVAAAVGTLVVILAFRLQAGESRVWVRRLGWGAVAAVVAQAGLGGAMVKLADPKALSIAHACLAQLCFGLVAAIAVAQTVPPAAARGSEQSHDRKGVVFRGSSPQILAAVVLFVQTILGAAVRHNAIGLIPHIAGAVAATIMAMWAGLSVLMRHMGEARLRRAAMGLLLLTMVQVFLGIAAYGSRLATADYAQPMPVMIWATVAHVAVGSLAFASAIALAMIYWHETPSELKMAHGGVAIA